MLEKTIESFFVPILLIVFFFTACTYNLAYFGTLGDSFLYVLYVPIGFVDIIKTGLTSSLLIFLFLIIFKPFLLDPAFKGSFPTQIILLIAAMLVLFSNVTYFLFFINSPNKLYSMASELMFYIFSIVGFFGLLYHFTREKSKQLIFVIFFCSLIPISLLVGWTNAKIDLESVSNQAKSKILFKSNKIVAAKILRSFEKGMFVLIGNDTGVNFISWDEIKEVKFKKVSGI